MLIAPITATINKTAVSILNDYISDGNVTDKEYFAELEQMNVVSKDFLVDNYNACASLKEELLIENASHTLAMAAGGEEAFNKLFKFLKENTK